MKKIPNELIIYENYAELVITRANGTKIHTQIDIDKIDLVKSKHWSYNNTGYIRSTAKEKYIPLHRFLLNAKEGLVVDHIDGNPLNNLMDNLRICTLKQNGQNARNRKVSSGIVGVRKDIRCKTSYRAQIYFSSNTHIEKTFKDKESAILRRLTWELMYFGEFAPQMELIEKEYPYLLNYLKVRDKMVFSNDMENIKAIGSKLKQDPHCPCMLKKNDNTLCPCLPCRTQQHCHCEFFVPIGSQVDYYEKKYNMPWKTEI